MLRNKFTKLAAEYVMQNPGKAYSTTVTASKFIASGVASSFANLLSPHYISGIRIGEQTAEESILTELAGKLFQDSAES